MKRFAFSRGFSVIQLLVVVGLIGILSPIILKMTTHGTRTMSYLTARQDLEMLRMTISQQFDCRQSLDISTVPPPQQTCSAKTVIPVKRRDGTLITDNQGRLGKWTIAAGCDEDEIIFSATREGKNPLTKKPWNEEPAADDLFGGTSDFCRLYFAKDGLSCVDPYPVFMGFRQERPKCCRRVSDAGPGPSYVSAAYCGAGEYATDGGYSCFVTDSAGRRAPSGFPPDGSGQPVSAHVHSSYGIWNATNTVQVGWVADCNGVPIDPTHFPHDVFSEAFAICCPF